MTSKSSKTADFFRKVGGAVLGVGKLPSKLKRRARKPKAKPPRKPKREVPQRLRDYFEQRHAGWPEYVMLKVQLAIVALFVVAAIYIVLLPAHDVVFLAALLALSVYVIYLAPTQLKRAFGRDYPAYRGFVGMCVAIVWVFVLVLRHFPVSFSLESPHLALIPPLLTMGLVFLAFLSFRLKYSRSFTYGTVEGVQGRRAAVRVGYDICSNVKSGLYFVESFVKVRKGDLVKISVDRPMLGLRGARVKAVMGKAK